MQALQEIIPLLISLSLAGLVLAVGLHSTREDVFYVLKRPKLLGRAILAVIVIPPIVAGLLVSVLPLEPAVKIGIMLMAISPVPPLVPGKELGIGGRKEYAYGLYVAMAVLTIVSVPIVLAITSSLFGRHDTIPLSRIADTVIGGVLVPLGLGLLIRRFAPSLAESCWRIIYKVSMALVVVAFIPILIKVWPAIEDLLGNGAALAMAAVSAIALAAGHMLGGPDPRDRATLATASSVRHPGIATMIAGATFHDPRVSAAILLFLLVGLVVSVPYKRWVKRHSSPPHHPVHA